MYKNVFLEKLKWQVNTKEDGNERKEDGVDGKRRNERKKTKMDGKKRNEWKKTKWTERDGMNGKRQNGQKETE